MFLEDLLGGPSRPGEWLYLSSRRIRILSEEPPRIAGKDVFSKDKWDLRCSFREDSAGLCHVFMFVAKEDVHFGHTYTKGTTVDCFTSYKYDQQRVHGMCREAGMRVTNSWHSEFKMGLLLS